jgi:hypothetical protein
MSLTDKTVAPRSSNNDLPQESANLLAHAVLQART